jgi:hypothetical protein
MASPAVPAWFLLQTSDLQLRQVSRVLIGSAPPEWRKQFEGAPFAPPTPLYTTEAARGSLPVYAVDVTLAELSAMLALLQTPEALGDYWAAVPAKVDKTLTAWRGLLRSYGWIVNDALVDAAQPTIELQERPKKRKRASASTQPQPLSPFNIRVYEAAAALGRYVFENHPKADAFRAGTTDQLVCVFVRRHSACTAECGETIVAVALNEADCCRVKDTDTRCIATFLDTYLWSWTARDTTAHVAKAGLLSAAPPGVQCGNSSSNSTVGWPMSINAQTPTRVCRKHFQVCELVFFA